MDSEAFAARGKAVNVNMVKKLTDVKQITKTNNNTELLLGPSGGGPGFGFGWNKAAAAASVTTVPKSSESSTGTHLTSSASFSIPSSSSAYSSTAATSTLAKQGGDDCDRRTILSSSSPGGSTGGGENKNAKKRYDRDFLLSLKDKKLSKAFPEVLQNFELAILDQMTSQSFNQQLNNPNNMNMNNKSQMMQQDQFGRIQQRRQLRWPVGSVGWYFSDLSTFNIINNNNESAQLLVPPV